MDDKLVQRCVSSPVELSQMTKKTDDKLVDSIADAVALRLQSKLLSLEGKLDALVIQVQQCRAGSDAVGQQAQAPAGLGSNGVWQQAQAPSDAAQSSGRMTHRQMSLDHLDHLQVAGMSTDLSVYETLKDGTENDDSSDDGSKTETLWTKKGFMDRLKACLNAEEPDTKGPLASCVRASAFAYAALTVIVFNIIFVCYTTDWVAEHETVELGWMKKVEAVFLLFYTVEVTLKLIVHHWYFFWNEDWAWNIFDLIVVASGIMQVGLEQFTDAHLINVQFLRIVRVLRVTRILRILKAFRFFSELRFMASCLMGSLGSLIWATLFFFLMLLIVALVFVQRMSAFRRENPCEDAELCEKASNQFGSVLAAVITLLQATTGGCDWGDVYDVIALTGPFTAALFVAFIIFFTFAFFNVVMSIFVEKAMKLAQPDAHEVVVEKRKESLETASQLRDLMKELDTDNSGTISRMELEEAATDDRIKIMFEMLGMSVREAQVFFVTLVNANKQNEVGIDEFVDACMRMKGPASGIDIQAIAFQIREIKRSMSQFAGACTSG